MHAQDRDDVVKAFKARRPIHPGCLQQLDLRHLMDVLPLELGEHPRGLVHRRDPCVGCTLEDVLELQTGAAADVENSDALAGSWDPRCGGAVQRRTALREFGVPQVGDVVEEVGQVFYVHSDAAGVAGDAARDHPKALELRVERALIVFLGHECSMPRTAIVRG